jgi:hypothetical protein
VQRELERMLDKDDSRVGDVYRHRDKSAEEIARDLGVRTAGFVANNRAIIRAVLEGVLPSGLAIRTQIASKVRTFRERGHLSGEAREYLLHVEERLTEGTQKISPPPPGERQASLGAPRGSSTLRASVEDELRSQVKDLVGRIRLKTGIEAVDYWAVATSPSPLDVIVRLVRAPGEQGTFKKLVDLKRIDLTLEEAVVAWAQDLPLQRDLVEDAEAKKDWFSS